MNNLNEHEIIVEHKNIFEPNRAGLLNLSLAMYPFSIPTDEYVPLNFLWQNILSCLTIDIFKTKHIMIFEINIHWYLY